MRQESFFSGAQAPDSSSPSGIALRTFVSADWGAQGFSTGTATFQDGAELASHIHDCSEVITVLSGSCLVIVEGRAYRLSRLDCMHVPAGIVHIVRNLDATAEMVAQWSFASAAVNRTFVADSALFEDRMDGLPSHKDPEYLRRFATAEVYELSPGAFFRDLFAQRFGSVGICGGYGRFTKGSSLPCHTHVYDESITILTGGATCLVQGASYELEGLAAAFVPQGKPHRFVNSGTEDMEMLWVYAGDEPDRVILDNRYCSGILAWPS